MGFKASASANTAGAFYARPSSSLGYWRGTGSPGGAGIAGVGGTMAGANPISGIFSAPSGAPSSGGWSPSVLYLLVLVVAEMFVFGFISRVLR